MASYINISQAQKKYGVSRGLLLRQLREGAFKTADLQDRGYIFDEEELKKLLLINEKYTDVKTVEKELDINSSKVYRLISQGELVAEINLTGNKKILKSSVEAYKNSTKGLLTVEEASDILNVSKEYIYNLISYGKLKCEKKHDKKCYFSNQEIERYRKSILNQQEYMTIKEIVEYLGKTEDTVRRIIELGEIEAIKYKQSWYCSISDVSKYKESMEQEETLKNKPFEYFEYQYRKFNIPNKIKCTLLSYFEFSIIKLNSSNNKRMITNTNKYLKVGHLLIQSLDKELFKYSDSEVEALLKNSLFLATDIEVLIQFLGYCQGLGYCDFNNKYNLNTKKSNEQEIYNVDEFLQYYLYVKDTSRHINSSLKDRKYCVMWVYVIMHLIDVWRHSDVLNNLPHIPIDLVEIHSFQDFKKLNINQAQLLINNVYSQIESMHISKTGALGHFLVHGDMVIPTATSLVLAELHRRKENDNKLLRLYSPPSESTKIDKTVHLKKFFKERTDLYNFSSLKMNRSLLTYFYYSVVEGGKNADMAYLLSQRLRGHKEIESTAIYIKSTNKDGNIDKVSLNLVNRGAFGWLYNLLLERYIDGDRNQNLEERTNYIMAFKAEYRPLKLELISNFLNQQLKERESIAFKISQMSKEKIEEILNNINQGKMPSKVEQAQCFMHPNCEYRNSIGCTHCEFIIPKTYFLISLNGEVERLIKSIQETQFKAIALRDYHFLIKILDLLSQATKEFGKEFVNSFIDLTALRKKLIIVSQSMSLIEEGQL